MTKVVQLSDEAYARLRARKRGSDSFSDVVLRAFPPASLGALAGSAAAKEVRDDEKRRRAIDAAGADRDARLARRRGGPA
ncbi:MAG: antitoxin VapB family protein [Thermoplasmatota archaeon]